MKFKGIISMSFNKYTNEKSVTKIVSVTKVYCSVNVAIGTIYLFKFVTSVKKKAYFTLLS